MKIIIKNIIRISLLIIIISCTNKKESNSDTIGHKTEENKLTPQVKSIKEITDNYNLQTKELAINFTEKLKTGQSLVSLMDKHWTLIYHEDNRCTGSTDGQKKNLPNTQIDSKITLKVKNNSEYAWACEKKEPYIYDLVFDLKKQIEKWDRFELKNDDYSDAPYKEKDVYYILGAGESDYIKIYFGENKLIETLKYSSVDPG